SLDGFSPTGLVGELHHHYPGLRIPRSRAVFEALLPSILEQKVTGLEAHNAFAAIVRAWGEPAPGPLPLRHPPPPDPPSLGRPGPRPGAPTPPAVPRRPPPPPLLGVPPSRGRAQAHRRH